MGFGLYFIVIIALILIIYLRVNFAFTKADKKKHDIFISSLFLSLILMLLYDFGLLHKILNLTN